MKNSLWIVSGIVGLILGFVLGNFVPVRHAAAVGLESGTYCCDRIDIAQKCEKKIAACPGDKPITVSIP
jgi:hypothetical protein